MSDKIFLKDITLPIIETGENETYSFVQTDSDLETAGDAADAKKTGDEITQLKADITDKAGKSEALGSYVVNTASGAIASFDDGADNVPVKDLTVQIVPYQAGTGDPSPENIRPITGWTAVDLRCTNDNLFVSGEATSNSSKRVYVAGSYMKAGTYYLLCTQKDDPDTTYQVGLYISIDNGEFNRSGSNYTIDAVKSFTLTRDCYVTAYVQGSNLPANKVFTRTLARHNITGHIPANGELHTITFPTEAGTVYGGTLDVTNGVLTVNKYYRQATAEYLSGISDKGYSASVGALGNKPVVWFRNFFYSSGSPYNPASRRSGGIYATCNAFPVDFNSNRISSSQDRIGFIVDGETINSVATFISAVEDMEENGSGLYVCYELKTPATYQLTPQEVSTLLGLNNIWADTGDVSVDYRADTKLYIENLTAPTEDDMVANTNIPNDTYFMIGNTLLLSTTTIPAGDTINPGTNCTKMDLAAALNALNA